jgi:membrane dipeptidase
MGRISPNLQDGAGTAVNLFENSLVWDNHACTTVRPAHADSLATLERYRASGIDVVCLNVGFDAAPREDAIVLLADFRRWIRAHAAGYTLVETVEDIERARKAGTVGVCFNLEGGCALFGHSSMVSLYYDLGVRWMLFAYNRNNALGGGCQDEDGGLTSFGAEVLLEMERVGMVVCCSHIGHRTAMDILERAQRPVIFSHSNPRALREHPRNISDEAIRACANTGGVVGINGIGVFLGENDIATDLIVRHIDYVVNMVGPDHVGIGLDFCTDDREVQDFVKAHPESYPPDQYPNGLLMMEPERLPRIAERLLRGGHSEKDVRNIMGGNHLRIARSVWR